MVDELANEIRRIDGEHDMGAGALADGDDMLVGAKSCQLAIADAIRALKETAG
jgi:hypothetical protein